METINAAIDSFPVRLKAVEALRGQSLNGHRDVIRDLHTGARTVEQVLMEREEEANAVETFVAESRDLFENRAPGARGMAVCPLALRSYEIVRKLPEVTRREAGFA